MTASQKICVCVLKYAPVVSTACLTLHIALLLFGFRPVLECVVGLTPLPSVVLFSASHAFRFCLLHKMLIGYSFAVDLCCSYERVVGFGNTLTPLRLLMLYIGVELLYEVAKIRGRLCWGR